MVNINDVKTNDSKYQIRYSDNGELDVMTGWYIVKVYMSMVKHRGYPNIDILNEMED